MPDFTIFSPVTGNTRPLEQVPDPAFAEKMLGDGLAVEPTGNFIVAPFDGEITSLHSSLHALTLKNESVEILIHIGVESVNLKGKGFKALVQAEQSVKKGQKLLEFDPIFLAKNIPCNWVITILTFPDGVNVEKTNHPQLTAGQDKLFSVPGVANSDSTEEKTTAQTAWSYSSTITIPNPNGLHARPAAALAQVAKKYSFGIELEYNGKRADAKSLVAIMGLAIAHHGQVRVCANAPQETAAEALRVLADLLAKGLGENVTNSEDAPSRHQTVTGLQADNTLQALTACSGIALGKTFQWKKEELSFPQTAEDPSTEQKRLTNAIEQTLHDLSAPSTSASSQAILQAHKELLQDPFLAKQATEFIQQGKSAPAAFNEAIRASIDVLKSTQNRFLMERMADLKDVRRKVLEKLTDIHSSKPNFPDDCIVFTEELLPSDIKEIDERVKGVVLAQGSPTAHASILLRNRGIPALVAAGPDILDVADGTPAILNASEGKLFLQPSEEIWKRAEQLLAKEKQTFLQAREYAHQPALTTDGIQIHITGNASNAEEAQTACQNGADGLGLVRTEFLFRQSDTAPTQEQQHKLYQQITDALQGTPVTLRTLDVGGDKPMSYMPLPVEENPIMGLRGVRNYQGYQDLFLTQIRAMLTVTPAGTARIMLPMIAFLHELENYRKIIEQEKQSLGISTPVQIGMMVEVPSAALLAEQFAEKADFFSIGTNDLTQYTLAIDRGHKSLCTYADPLHPAVLKLIGATCKGAEKHHKPVAVCGAIAGDLDAVPLLIGLGVTELAVSANLIAPIKALVRKISKQQVSALAQQALQCTDSQCVRALVKKEFSK